MTPRTELPPVAPAVVADVLDALPPRLRKRVDAALDQASDWEVTREGDVARAAPTPEATLTWTLHDGVLATADELVCSCLLAPRCLHRGVAVAAAGIAEAPNPDPPTNVPDPAAPDPAAPNSAPPAPAPPAAGVPAGLAPASAPSPATPAPPSPTPIREDERTAATALWQACATVLRSGATGSGAVVRAELLRAVHRARLAGLHRAAANGLRIASSLAAARTGDSSFDRAVLTAELVELMLLCHDLRAPAPTDPAELRGTARREYHPVGSLRLHGLCTEPVVTTSGYGGVVTHLVDENSRLWTVQSVLPGGPERVPAAAGGPVAVGESGLTHRELGRSGLLLSGGTGSPDHRLGAGRSVRAVAAAGAAWDAPPLADLWAPPLADQVVRAFHARSRPDGHRPAAADLLFLDAVVLGVAGPALRVDAGGAHVDLVGDGERARDNLRVLAGAGGLRVKVVARLLPDRPGTAAALAVAGDLDLPADLRHHVDLGLDRLQRSHVAGDGTRALPPRPAPADHLPQPLRPLVNVLHRIALGGRAVAAVASAARDVSALTRTGLTTTADLLADLAATSRDRERDAFGRVVRDAGDDFPTAWLRAGVHVREFTRAAARRAWLDAVTTPDRTP
ncbi:hypothetical protein [Saccharothrix syringae]|uniref:SWIM-type domain-containing protein n=1 Tax=Saccharothrix syringae TaxID=103733 RepID=A0A5Q0H1B4_SACSY|nr:hypothetical protein [Saccharothrix syringae]QFZ19462.1 hypothetical protein EKG83_20250 [Saccharothrix syringae]